jgi:polyphosphate kinase 2 (PPK2 family)
VVEGADANYRNLTVGTTLRDAIAARLAQKQPKVSSHAAPIERPIDGVERLQALKFTERLSKEKYEKQLPKVQRRLHELTMHPKFKERSVIVVFEGNDAAGKGGAIRRITGALDARHYRVIPIAAPTEEERAQHYLWRFWRHMPKVGSFTIFDRSWYGRVLVERVEGFATQDAWMRAYSEINDFEEQLATAGGILVKCWLAVTKDEQLRRFKERERTRFKRFKITQEDWRNRDKWGAYEQAANDMLERTSSDVAPWTIIEANDKHLARIRTLTTLCDAIEARL